MRTNELMDKEVKKQIGVLRVSNPVGLLARKSWNVLLLNAYDDLLVKSIHEIPVNVLSDVIGYNSEDQEALKTSLKKLQTTLVEWDIGGQSKRKGVSFSNFASVQMLGGVKIENGIVKYEFSNMLAEILHNPLIYQKINLLQQRVFKTSYALYLWENCLRYIKIGTTGFSPVEEWRKLLGATAKSYEKYKEFYRCVLFPAIKETNELSNITVTLQAKKTGRKITDLCFLVEYKKQKQLSMINGVDETKESKEYKELVEYGISSIQSITFIQEYGFKYVKDKISYIKQLEKNNHTFKSSKSGFLISAIEKDWKNDKQLDFKKEEVKINEKRIEENQKKKKELETRRKSEKEKIKLISILETLDVNTLKSKVEYIVNNHRVFTLGTRGAFIMNMLKITNNFNDFKANFLSSGSDNAMIISELKKEFLI